MTDEERYLVAQIRELQESYHRAAEPLVQRLTAIAACKQPRYFIELEPGDTPPNAERFMQ